jgi:signal transduction histidine kinase
MRSRTHPILRFAPILLCGVGAAGTIVLSARINVHSVSWLVAGYASLVLCLYALRAPRSPVRSAYGAYHAILAAYLFLVWMLHASVPAARRAAPPAEMVFCAQLLRFGSVYLPVALFFFCRRFLALDGKPFRIMEVIGWVVASLLYLLSFAGLFFSSYRWTGVTWVPTMTKLYPVYALYGAAYVSITVAATLYKIVSDRKRRPQFIFFIIGAGPLWAACLSNLLLSLGIRLYPTGGLFFVAHIAILAYAVLYYKVYDVSVLIRKGLVYAIVSVGLGAALGVLLWVTPSWIGFEGSGGMWPAIGFGLAAAFVYAPALGLTQRFVDRVFFRREADAQKMLQQLLRDTTATLDLDEVARHLCRFFDDLFYPQSISLYFMTDDKRLVLFATYDGAFHRLRWPDGETVLHPALLDEKIQPQRPLQFVSGESGIRVPINHNSQLLGWIILGPKRADDSYDEHDMHLAEMATAHVGLAAQNAWAYQSVQYLGHLNEQTISSLTVAVFVIRENGQIIQSNPRASILLGNTGSPQSLNDILKAHGLLGQTVGQAVKLDEECTNVPVTSPDTPASYLLLTVRRLARTTGERQFLVLVSDISDYKMLELNAQRLEGLAKLGQTIAAINHEVRNILQPIQMQMKALESVKSDDERVKRALSVIPDRLSAMEKVLSGLKDLSRPMELRLRNINVAELIQSAWMDVQELPFAQGVAFEFDPVKNAVECQVDGNWMRMVFCNLLRNAAEATQERPVRRIDVCTCVSQDMLRVDISDTGCGITESNRKKLFELFFSTKGAAGTGLGLSICQRVVNFHGGHIDVFSMPDVGTTFQITLPLRHAEMGC